MIRTDKAVIRVFQVGFQGDDCLLSHVLNLLHEITDIFTFAHQILYYRREQLLRAFIVILKLFAGCFKPLRILIKTEVCQMHVVVFDVMGIGFLVIVCTETSQTLITKVRLDRIHSSNKYVQSTVEFLLI